MSRKYYWVAGASGLLMAVALALGGLTRPEVILGWVEFFGRWDPTMLIFFAFGVPAYHLMWRWAQARERLQRGPVLSLPTARTVDARLVVGAAIFGVGWGLGGVCPGPGFTSLGAGASWAVTYVAALAAGLWLPTGGQASQGRSRAGAL